MVQYAVQVPNVSEYGFVGFSERRFARNADEASYTASTSSAILNSSPVALELYVPLPSTVSSIVSPAAYVAAASEKSFVTTAVAGLFHALRGLAAVPFTSSATAVQPVFRFHALAVTAYVPARGTVKRSTTHWLPASVVLPGWQESSPGWIAG